MSEADIFIENTFNLLSPKVLWVFVVFALGILFTISLALMYHWKEYALAHHVKNVTAQKWYKAITMILVLISLCLLIIYTTLS